MGGAVFVDIFVISLGLAMLVATYILYPVFSAIFMSGCIKIRTS